MKLPTATLADHHCSERAHRGVWQLTPTQHIMLCVGLSGDRDSQLLKVYIDNNLEAVFVDAILRYEPRLALHYNFLKSNVTQYTRASNYGAFVVIGEKGIIQKGNVELLKYLATKVRVIESRDFSMAKRFDASYPKGLNNFIKEHSSL